MTTPMIAKNLEVDFMCLHFFSTCLGGSYLATESAVEVIAFSSDGSNTTVESAKVLVVRNGEKKVPAIDEKEDYYDKEFEAKSKAKMPMKFYDATQKFQGIWVAIKLP